MIQTETGLKRELTKKTKHIRTLEQRVRSLEEELKRVYTMIETDGEHQTLTEDYEVKFNVKVISKEPIDLSENGHWTEVY